MAKSKIRIGGASGYWGDAQNATTQLLGAGDLDYIVYDYLAEITMSIMARARAINPEMGYAPDFVSSAMAPNLKEIARQGVKIISNAGGVNPLTCARALEQQIEKAGVGLKVACITGDDLLDRAGELANCGIRGMFKGEAFPPADKIASINIYTGAFAIARALDMGADIVITGRCVDSAVTLGPCIHSFGWQPDSLDNLASGSLAGHIIECGAQVTGGNFTDWELCADTMGDIGYPIVEIGADGEFIVSKPDGTGGLVSNGTVAEQIVYEIGDPQRYQLPDVTCDFSQVKLHQEGENRVRVSGATGFAAPEKLKAVVTWMDGYRGGHLLTFYGFDADKKAKRFADAVIAKCRSVLRDNNLADFNQSSVEVLGAESQYGAQAQVREIREVCVKIAARHPTQEGIALLLREVTGMALSGPPGLSGFAGTRPRPSPVVAMFGCLLARDRLTLGINIAGQTEKHDDRVSGAVLEHEISRPAPPDEIEAGPEMFAVPLIKLAYGRSGDKGDKANIGIIARDKKFFPYIWAQLNEGEVAQRFSHFLACPNEQSVERYILPGIAAINFVMNNVLDGGGTASLRNDPQAKGYAQLLLAHEIEIPVEMAAGLL